MQCAEPEKFLSFHEEKSSNEASSRESEQLMNDIRCLKYGLSLILKKTARVLECEEEAFKEFIECSNEEDIKCLKNAVKQEFFFPILYLRKLNDSEKSCVPKSIEPLVSEIKSGPRRFRGPQGSSLIKSVEQRS